MDADPSKPHGTIFRMVDAGSRVVLQMKARSVAEKDAWLKRLAAVVQIVRTAPRFNRGGDRASGSGGGARAEGGVSRGSGSGSSSSSSSEVADGEESVAVRRFVDEDSGFQRLKGVYATDHARWRRLRAELYAYVTTNDLLAVPSWATNRVAMANAIGGGGGGAARRLAVDDLDVFNTNSAAEVLAAGSCAMAPGGLGIRCFGGVGKGGGGHRGDPARRRRSRLRFPPQLGALWRSVGDARTPAGSVLWSWVYHLPTLQGAGGGGGRWRRTSTSLAATTTTTTTPTTTGVVDFVPPEAMWAFIDHLTLTVAKLCRLRGPRDPTASAAASAQR